MATKRQIKKEFDKAVATIKKEIHNYPEVVFKNEGEENGQQVGKYWVEKTRAPNLLNSPELRFA